MSDPLIPTEQPSNYQCSFCPEQESYACSACGKRYCNLHGGVIGSKCYECSDLALASIGDTYQFRMRDGRLVEDISVLEDLDLRQFLEMYATKVRELETLLISAKKQYTGLQRQLKLIPASVPGEPGKISVSASAVKPRGRAAKASKSVGKEALEALAAMLLSGGNAKNVIDKLKGEK